MNDYQTAMEGMKNALTSHDELIRSFNRSAYQERFQKYYLSLVGAMDAIETLYGTVLEKDTMLSNMAHALTASAAGIIESAPRRQREQIKINLSLTMAGYVFPALLRYQGASSKPLVDAVLKSWKESFPKSNLTPADYESIEAGFHRKFCFITTAACQMTGRADDCYELTLLRNYRDRYLLSLPGGEDLVNAYYDVAPSIVKHIGRREDASVIYQGIWKDYIAPCITLIEQGAYAACRDLYMEMVRDLKDRYFYLDPNGKNAA